MLQYIAKRLLGLLPTLVIVGLLVFLFVHLLPGDPARLAAGPDATPETVEPVRRDLGLDRPLPEQFARFAAACSLGAALNWLVSIGLFLYLPWFAGRVGFFLHVDDFSAAGMDAQLRFYQDFQKRILRLDPRDRFGILRTFQPPIGIFDADTVIVVQNVASARDRVQNTHCQREENGQE